MTRDLATRLEQKANELKHRDGGPLIWEEEDQIRSLLREASAMIGMCSALLGPDKLILERLDEGIEVTIVTVLQSEETEELISLFAEHA